MQVPGTPYATPPAELEQARRLLARHRRKSRAEAQAAPEGGGRAEASRSPSRTAASRCPTSRSAIWLIDQWRQVGLNVKQEVIEAAAYYARARARATSRWRWTSSAATSSSPTSTCTSSSRATAIRRTTAATRTGCSTTLYDKQSRATDVPRSARSSSAQFEKRLLDEEAHYLMTLQWHRIIPHIAQGARAGQITPSHYLNNHARHGLAVGVTEAPLPARAGSQSGAGVTRACGQYIVKRFLLMIPTLLGVAVLIFLLLRVVPGRRGRGCASCGRAEPVRRRRS